MWKVGRTLLGMHLPVEFTPFQAGQRLQHPRFSLALLLAVSADLPTESFRFHCYLFVVLVNRCVNWNLFWKTLEKIGYLSIRAQGSQWADSINDRGNLAALTQTIEKHKQLGRTGWWLTQHQRSHKTEFRGSLVLGSHLTGEVQGFKQLPWDGITRNLLTCSPSALNHQGHLTWESIELT